MKTIFDKATRDELINRINRLDENGTPQWGKMNTYQMLKHCTLFDEMLLGKINYKRALMGRIFGKIALKGLIKNENPLKKNLPTSPQFKISENGDTLAGRKKWITLIGEYENFHNDGFVHWFFGKMTKEQIGYFAYKHSDHHLRQFNN